MYKLNTNMMRLAGKTRPLYFSQYRNFSFSWPCPRKLREIVKISAFEKEDAETCQMIWNEYHHAKNHTVSTVLNEVQYKELFMRGKSAPMFIFPVPKGPAPEHFVLVSQVHDKSFVGFIIQSLPLIHFFSIAPYLPR